MSQETEPVLRMALHAVDRRKQFVVTAVIAVGIVVAVVQMRLAFLNRTGDVALILSVGVLEFWMAIWAIVIVLQITVATKKILRAIELAARPPA
jgi:hypothetical protein